MLIVAWMILFLFCYTYINLKKVSMTKKILSKFSSIVSKHDVLTYIFCIFLHQILPPWNIRLQLDFHIDHKQIKEIPGKIRQLRDYYIYFECSIYFWCTGLQIFSGKFNKYLSKSKCDFCICLYIDTLHCTYIYYLIFYF